MSLKISKRQNWPWVSTRSLWSMCNQLWNWSHNRRACIPLISFLFRCLDQSRNSIRSRRSGTFTDCFGQPRQCLRCHAIRKDRHSQSSFRMDRLDSGFWWCFGGIECFWWGHGWQSEDPFPSSVNPVSGAEFWVDAFSCTSDWFLAEWGYGVESDGFV